MIIELIENVDVNSIKAGDIVLFDRNYPKMGVGSMHELINSSHGSHMFLVLFINKPPHNKYGYVILLSSSPSRFENSRNEYPIPDEELDMDFHKPDKPFFYACVDRTGLVNLEYVRKIVGHAPDYIVRNVMNFRNGFANSLTDKERKLMRPLENLDFENFND